MNVPAGQPKPSSPSTPSAGSLAWLAEAIGDGFARLIVQRLDGAPGADMIVLTTAEWVDVLAPTRDWDEQRDLPLVQDAFRLLRMHCERWPSVAKFRTMFASVVPLERGPRLAAPTTIPKTREERREHLRKLLGEFDTAAMPLDPG